MILIKINDTVNSKSAAHAIYLISTSSAFDFLVSIGSLINAARHRWVEDGNWKMQ